LKKAENIQPRAKAIRNKFLREDWLLPDAPAPGAQKKPGIDAGFEALLLSHIKAPAQGGKAGSGKPLDKEFNKGKVIDQVNSDF
jgi:hypothetical protein